MLLPRRRAGECGPSHPCRGARGRALTPTTPTRPDPGRAPPAPQIYEGFFADFGPLNLGDTYRFCRKVHQLIDEGKKNKKVVYVYTRNHPQSKANTAVLLGAYCILYLDRSVDECYKVLSSIKPFAPFRDASCTVTTFNLTVLDCLKGIHRAKTVGFIDFHLPGSTFDVHEYEHYERVENGDLNWIVPGKFLAFCGPHSRKVQFQGYSTMVPEDYTDYFTKTGVSAVVRLNKKMYERKRFVDAGINHYDLFFPDGSCPPNSILQRFLQIAEKETGGIAIHCKAGLGRTGVLISCYNMKHFNFTAREAISFIRICRPGSVIGPQQQFLCKMEQQMWQEGVQYRKDHSLEAPDRTLSPESPIPSASMLQDRYHPTSPMKSLHTGTGNRATLGATLRSSANTSGVAHTIHTDTLSRIQKSEQTPRNLSHTFQSMNIGPLKAQEQSPSARLKAAGSSSRARGGKVSNNTVTSKNSKMTSYLKSASPLGKPMAVVQRHVNAAGQPRKVIEPDQMGSKIYSPKPRTEQYN